MIKLNCIISSGNLTLLSERILVFCLLNFYSDYFLTFSFNSGRSGGDSYLHPSGLSPFCILYIAWDSVGT